MAQVSKQASDVTRSIGGSCCFVARPLAEREPLMDCGAEKGEGRTGCTLARTWCCCRVDPVSWQSYMITSCMGTSIRAHYLE